MIWSVFGSPTACRVHIIAHLHCSHYGDCPTATVILIHTYTLSLPILLFFLLSYPSYSYSIHLLSISLYPLSSTTIFAYLRWLLPTLSLPLQTTKSLFTVIPRLLPQIIPLPLPPPATLPPRLVSPLLLLINCRFNLANCVLPRLLSMFLPLCARPSVLRSIRHPLLHAVYMAHSTV